MYEIRFNRDICHGDRVVVEHRYFSINSSSLGYAYDDAMNMGLEDYLKESTGYDDWYLDLWYEGGK